MSERKTKYQEICRQAIRGSAIALSNQIIEHRRQFGENMTEEILEYLNKKLEVE